MYEVFESESELFIVMEVCAGGELFDRIKEQPDGNYSENDAADVLRQIAEGLKYLHAHRIAHCDLKRQLQHDYKRKPALFVVPVLGNLLREQ